MRADVLMKTPITGAQIKKIHTLKNVLAMADDLYRLSLQGLYGVTSSKELNQIQAADLIDFLETKATELGVWECTIGPRKRLNGLGKRRGMASPGQLQKIEAQWQRVSRVEQPEERAKALRHLVERISKVSDLRFLDTVGAGKVLNALKAMQREKAKSSKKGV
jgi:hypothetical protein